MKRLKQFFSRRHERILKAVMAISSFIEVLFKWLYLTFVCAWRLENIKQVLIETTALLQSAIARQSDNSLNLIRSANKSIAKNNLVAAQTCFDEAIRLYPHKAEPHFLRASCLTYLKGQPLQVDREIAYGLRINKKEAEFGRLDTLALRILGDEFAGMGHLSLLDPLLKLKALGAISNHHLMIVTESSVANRAYLDCWSKYLPIRVTNAMDYSAAKTLFAPIFENVSMIELGSSTIPIYEAWNMALNAWGDRPPLLELNARQRQAGERVLEQIGMKKSQWFVGIHVREGEKGGHLRSGADANIDDYLPAIRRIIEMGGWVIRMGKGGTAIAESAHLWDYANSEHQSDWMDVFLWAACKFFIGTSSGPLTVPPTFGKPVLYTNACSLGTSPNLRNSLMIPKLFRSKRRGVLLTFKEMLEGPYGWTVLPSYDDGDTELVSNSPDEIVAAVDELMAHMENPAEFAKNGAYQSEFDRVRAPYRKTSQARIAECFARTHADLIT
jgi:putative glycosyltransferase (TIGR04372 family)